MRSLGKSLESILQAPRKDSTKRYIEGRPDGSYFKICLNGVNTMDFDMSIEKRKEIIDTINSSA